MTYRTDSYRFLERKYRWIASIDFEVEDLVSPDDADQAVEIFEALPDGFVKDWRWGLGIHVPAQPGAGFWHPHSVLRMAA